jgi:DNA-binding Lrp family transcriptional regulator
LIRLDQKAEILMRHFRDGDSQRKISDDLKISRTTVRKYIGEENVKFKELDQLGHNEEKHREQILLLIEEIASKPKYDTSSRTKLKLTEDIIEEIKSMLLSNENNRALGRHKQLMKNTDIHEKLLEKGYDIGYTTVYNYIRDNYNTKEAYVRQEYQLGETMEFDWGEVKLTIGGKMLTFQMGLMTTAKRRTESRVNKYSVINIDQNKYSVSDYLVGKFVKVKIYPEEIKIYYKESKTAEHIRSFQNHKWIIDINHFIHTLKKKPGALHSSVGRHQLSPELQETYQRYYTNNPRDFIELLELIKEKDTTTVLSAIKELKTIKESLVTTDNIKNIVYKLPGEDLRIKREDVEIFESSTKQIQELNNLFNLESMGRYEN